MEGAASDLGVRHPLRVEQRILPVFEDIPLGDLDASTIGAWKSAMLAERLSPQTVNAHLSVAAGDQPEHSKPNTGKRRRRGCFVLAFADRIATYEDVPHRDAVQFE